MHIFGIKIDQLNKNEVTKKIEEFLNDGRQHYIVTPNPEILLRAGQEEEFFYILNKADLSVPDGIGLKFASWIMFKNLKIYPGADLTKDILKIASEKELVVAVVNWKNGLSTANDILKKMQGEKRKTQVFDVDYELSENEINKINEFKPEIIFCTFGAPYQEKFIYHNLPKLPTVKLALGVGASFDYISGKAKRAPWILRKAGLEWFWRLFKILLSNNNDGKIYKANRIKRIYQAVFKFSVKFFKWRFVWPFMYRENVACFLYKKSKSGYQILLVERQGEPDHWQIPQGGTEGLDIEAAGKKELKEEIGNNKFKFIKIYKHLYKYKFWDDISGKYKSGSEKLQKHAGYRGQKQNLYVAEYFGDDRDIKINFWDHSAWKWVDVDNFINSVHPTRKKAAEIYLEKFKSLIK